MKKLIVYLFAASFGITGSTFNSKVAAQAPLAWANMGTTAATQQTVKAMQCNSSGNIVAAGLENSSLGYLQTKVKIQSKTTGAVLNSASFTPSTGVHAYNDGVAGVAVDASNNVYVLADVYFDATYLRDVVLIKYNSSLVKQWERYTYGTGTSNDYARAITLDASGNVFITGYVGNSGSGTGADIFTCMFNSAGTLQWKRFFNGAGNNVDISYDIKVFGTDVYVCGYSYSASLNYSGVVIKYPIAGSSTTLPSWTKAIDYNTTGTLATTSFDGLFSMAVNSAGVYVAGESYINTTNLKDMTLHKLSLSTGSILFSKYSNGTNGNDVGTKVGLDNSGNVVVGGNLNGFTKTHLRKYTGTGALSWSYTYDDTAEPNERLYDMKVSSTGTVYFTGNTYYGSSYYYMINVKVSSAGVLQWSDKYTFPGSEFETSKGVCIAVNEAQSSVYFGGEYIYSSTQNSWLINKYSPSLRIGDETDETIKSPVAEISVFPNPASDYINVNSTLTNGTILLISVTGQIVKEMSVTDGKAVMAVSGVSPGTYFVKFNSENETTTKKVIIN